MLNEQSRLNSGKPLIKHIFLSLTFFATSNLYAKSWTETLRSAVLRDPGVRESIANEGVASSLLEQAKAEKWPVISVVGGQRIISTENDDDSDNSLGLQGRYTLYDFGKNKAAVNQKSLKENYFSFKTEETTEELINQLTGYYLEALKAKLSLAIAKNSLTRHQKIVSQVQTIVKYDPGRRSELTQARSRMLKAKEDIINYNRSLKLSLMRLSRYVSPAIKENEVSDPFARLSIKQLIARYPVTEDNLQYHPSYIAQKNEMESIKAEQIIAEKSRWPSLDLVGQVSEDESSVFLNVNVDLLNLKKTPQIDEKVYQVQAARARMNNVKRNLKERSGLAALSMQEDEIRYKLAKDQIRELKQVAEDYQDQFFIAKRSLLDVVNAYRELSTMELVSVHASYDVMKAKLDYLSSVGALRIWSGLDKEKKSLQGQLVMSPKAKKSNGLSTDIDEPFEQKVKKTVMLSSLNASHERQLINMDNLQLSPLTQVLTQPITYYSNE